MFQQVNSVCPTLLFTGPEHAILAGAAGSSNARANSSVISLHPKPLDSYGPFGEYKPRHPEPTVRFCTLLIWEGCQLGSLQAPQCCAFLRCMAEGRDQSSPRRSVSGSKFHWARHLDSSSRKGAKTGTLSRRGRCFTRRQSTPWSSCRTLLKSCCGLNHKVSVLGGNAVPG